MKIHITPIEPKFKPRTLSITFESQDELNAFGRLFNLSPISSLFREMGGADAAELYHAVEALGGDIRIDGVLALLQKKL